MIRLFCVCVVVDNAVLLRDEQYASYRVRESNSEGCYQNKKKVKGRQTKDSDNVPLSNFFFLSSYQFTLPSSTQNSTFHYFFRRVRDEDRTMMKEDCFAKSWFEISFLLASEKAEGIFLPFLPLNMKGKACCFLLN